MGIKGGIQSLDGLSVCLYGGGGGGPTVPTDISGLLFWYKADSLGGYVDNQAITSWSDSSGGGLTATPNGVGCKYRASVINSKPAVEFVGDHLTFSSTNLGTSQSVFLVIRPLSGFSDGVFLGGNATGKYAPYIDGTDVYYRPQLADSFVSVAHGGLTTNTGYLIEIVRNGLSVSFYKNAVQIGTTQTLSANTALDVVEISGLAGGVLDLQNMQIAELFVYSTALSTSDRQAMETYVNNRYALF